MSQSIAIMRFLFFNFKGGVKESNIVKDSLDLTVNMPHEHITQALANLSTCIKLGNCELPIKQFK